MKSKEINDYKINIILLLAVYILAFGMSWYGGYFYDVSLIIAFAGLGAIVILDSYKISKLKSFSDEFINSFVSMKQNEMIERKNTIKSYIINLINDYNIKDIMTALLQQGITQYEFDDCLIDLINSKILTKQDLEKKVIPEKQKKEESEDHIQQNKNKIGRPKKNATTENNNN